MKTTIAQRAAALLPRLWQTGEGATVVEQLNSEWLIYQAQIHVEQGARKKAVGVWRLKAGVHGAYG